MSEHDAAPSQGTPPVTPFQPAVPGAAASTAPRVPGSAGDGFQRFPTGMMDIPAGAPPAPSGAAADPDGEGQDGQGGGAGWAGWVPASAPMPGRARARGIAAWALAFSIAGLIASFFVGWGFPVSLVGLVTGAMALRRPLESRALAAWALALGVTGLVYSAGWLVFAALTAELFS